ASVRIVAEGLVENPTFGASEFAGSGSGFIIDPSGIVVTNNHVVTGSSLRRVYVGGDNTRELEAVILGASECSDLAVLQVQPPGEFPYLEWFPDPVQPSAETLYAVGYPDDVYRQDPGTVNTDPALQATEWSASRQVVEISANIIPGNSGGPLVNEEGQVVGVNYAGIAETDQSFAIAAGEASRVVEQLRQGTNVEYIGINGIAVLDQDSGISGVYVAGVQPGSPADNAGVVGGDLIISLGGHSVASDGTMSEYCSILRSNRPTDPIEITVFNLTQRTCHSGQLNNPQRQLSDTPVECPFEVTSPEGEVMDTLLGLVPPAVQASCEEAPVLAGATASVRCEPAAAEVSAVYYDLYPDAATRDAAYQGQVDSAGLTRDEGAGCFEGEPSESTYTIAGQTVGRAVCYFSDVTETAVLIWSIDAANVIAFAFGSSEDIAELYEWWTLNATLNV
ncbi:MAG: S1C family serine protease, partial [Chloroflexota bacterium]|nr:S1C family serine protease [Chloroflexota bacterium]